MKESIKRRNVCITIETQMYAELKEMAIEQNRTFTGMLDRELSLVLKKYKKEKQ